MEEQNQLQKGSNLSHDLVRKIRLQRGIHDILEDSSKKLLTIQKIINVCSGAFITLVVFADFGLIEKIKPSISGFPIMLGVATVALLVFIMNSLYDVFSVADKNTTHLRAIQQYTDLLSDLKKSKHSSLKKEIDENTLVHFHSRYLQIGASVSSFGGNTFEKAQKKYLKKRALRKATEQLPFGSRQEILKIAKLLTEQCKQEEGEI